MKLAFQYIYLILSILLGLLTVTSAQTNGDFSTGLTGWAVTGSVSVQTYASGPLASFNGTPVDDTPNDGVVSQSVPTVVGRTYTVAFDMGATGSAMGEQKLDLNGQVFSLTKDQPGTQWTKQSFTLTATASITTLTFKDVSTVTNGIDLLLDNVVVALIPLPPVVITLAPCKLTWDAIPGCEYRVYAGSELLQTAQTNVAIVTLADDRLSTVTASAVDALTGIEGPRSEPLVVQPIISWETSNAVGWNKIAVGFIDFNPIRRFYRVSYPLTHTPTP